MTRCKFVTVLSISYQAWLESEESKNSMKREFNTTGLCVANRHYMVDISDKLNKIKELIDNNKYFTINRSRQYGKTTTLSALKKMLYNEYIVASISFEGLDEEYFSSPESFCKIFTILVNKSFKYSSADKDYIDKWINNSVIDFISLDNHVNEMCKNHKVVLFIDEVDKTSNNKVFLNFLSMLRDKYLKHIDGEGNTFQSVVLAGVYDIKNIKLKLVNQGYHILKESEGTYNSPWNIAINFNIDMSFNPDEIATMLRDYESEHGTGMDICGVSHEIYGYTSGYPFLVSRICQCIDENLDKDFTISGVENAVNIILDEKNTLFDDMFKNMENYADLYQFVYEFLVVGESKSYQISNPLVDLGVTLGFFKNNNGKVAIANKIFEILIFNYFISKDESNTSSRRIKKVLPYDIIEDEKFNMQLCLEKFAKHYREMFNENDIPFLERHGRMLFLTYLKPLINGVGFYHIESNLTDSRRMDVIVDYKNDQFIIELKIWYGESKHQKAYEQLCNYLDTKNVMKGYLLTFDFREERNKAYKAEWIHFNEKEIFDVVC